MRIDQMRVVILTFVSFVRLFCDGRKDNPG